MRNSPDEVVELIIHARKQMLEIEAEVRDCLKNKTISECLRIEIKNFFENLRSALDYSMHEIFLLFYHVSIARKNFPYALKNQDLRAFRVAGKMENVFPNLTASRPDVVQLFETFQWWNPNFEWIPDFMEMNNESKHMKLSPCTTVTGHDVKIVGGGTFKMPEGIGINFGPNATIKYGNKIVPAGNKRFDSNTAVDLLGGENVLVLPWIDFRFNFNRQSILLFLKTVLSGTEMIIEKLSLIK